MRSPIGTVVTVGMVLAAGVIGTVLAQPQGTRTPTSGSLVAHAETTTRIVASAQAVMATLDDAGRAKLQFPFDGPQKTRWSNLPNGAFQREGLRLADLTTAQRTAVTNLLRTALSGPGYQKVTEIMHGDEVLRQGGGGNGPGGARRGGGGGAAGGPPTDGGGRGRGMPGGGVAFGEDQYYLAFVGTPSAKAPWMLQFGGHHLAINLTLGASQATLAPSHTAAQPATYSVEGRTVRPLGAENDKAFTLINALDDGQRGQAVLNYRVADLVLGPGKDGRTIQPEGVKATALNAAQQSMLLELIREWTGIMNDTYAEPRMAEIKTNLPQTYFAWSGPTTNGSVAYFRIQGPTLVIEYAPQNGVDHIHTIYRDPTNDYGAKFARR
ncbi:MAG: DUF3500 domain-containing protein [Acidobacteriota bacterium]